MYLAELLGGPGGGISIRRTKLKPRGFEWVRKL